MTNPDGSNRRRIHLEAQNSCENASGNLANLLGLIRIALRYLGNQRARARSAALEAGDVRE